MTDNQVLTDVEVEASAAQRFEAIFEKLSDRIGDRADELYKRRKHSVAKKDREELYADVYEECVVRELRKLLGTEKEWHEELLADVRQGIVTVGIGALTIYGLNYFFGGSKEDGGDMGQLGSPADQVTNAFAQDAGHQASPFSKSSLSAI